MSDMYPPGEHIPFCMGPEGGGACVGYRALYDNWLRRIHCVETLERAVLEQSARINEMRAALREIKDQYLTPEQSSALAKVALAGSQDK